MSREPHSPPAEARSAAEWFVALDASAAGDAAPPSGGANESADRDAALARCAAAVAIARGLAGDPELRWAYDEAAAIASGRARPRVAKVRRRLAWLGAGLAAAAAAAAIAIWPLRTPPSPAAETAAAASRAADIVAAAAPVAPVVLLPGGVAVDANSVAILPFQSTGAEPRLDGAQLERAIVAELAAVPGIYVRGGKAVAPYAQTDLSAAEIGVLLGTRGIVAVQVERRASGAVVHAQLADAATGAVIWSADYDTAVAELGSVSTAIVEDIAATLVDPALRRSALRAASPARADHTLASVAEAASDR